LRKSYHVINPKYFAATLKIIAKKSRISPDISILNAVMPILMKIENYF
jgi:hypothetical protein